MRILVLNGMGGDGVLALVERRLPDTLHRVRQIEEPGRGGATRLAGLLRDMLAAAGWPIASLGLIAVVTGPGSFTGLRATLALAQGIALGAGLELQGVTGGEALTQTVLDLHAATDGPSPAMPIWCVVTARRDRVFLMREGHAAEAFMIDSWPEPVHPVLLAGDAAALVAARIEALGGVACSSPVDRPDVLAIASVALDRLEGRRAAIPILPLYVDAPEAKLPAAGLRPPPA